MSPQLDKLSPVLRWVPSFHFARSPKKEIGKAQPIVFFIPMAIDRPSSDCFMNEHLRYSFPLIALCAATLAASAQEDSVMRSVTLNGVEVRAFRYSSKLRNSADGRSTLDMSLLRSLPQILGSSDPIHYSQMLPEIQTNGEYRGGINIQGCENSHSMVSIGSIPVYYPSHLLGFFSTFNTSHYDKCSISKFTDAKMANILGGELAMELPSADADSLCGEVSLGMISSQATVNVPLGRNTTARVSARKTYINMLYGRWLSSDETNIDYSFYDVNLTLNHRLNRRSSLTLDYYGGQDNGIFKQGSYTARLHSKWGNQLVGLHHNCVAGNGLSMFNKLYFTTYRNKFWLNMQESQYKLPSRIMDVGFKHRTAYKRWTFGVEAVYHHIEPQKLETTGTLVANSGYEPSEKSMELSAYVICRQPLLAGACLEAGLRGSLYKAQSVQVLTRVDPSLKFCYEHGGFDFFAGYALKHQFLFQTGFSDAGLPTEFWLSASDAFKAQYAHSLSIGASYYIFSRRYKASASVFYKQLHHQMEFVGSIFDLVNSAYRMEDHLKQGSGRNYGFSLMLNKCSGRLTGWVNYTYTHARRKFHFNGRNYTYPASHERPHELDAVVTYGIGRHWDAGSTLVCASGTPFTAADYLYLVNGNVIAHFKEHNSNRLKPYCRWDVSVSYKWKPRFARECGFNLSVYNLTARNNQLFYYISTHSDGSFAYKPKSFVAGILPSLSFYCKF